MSLSFARDKIDIYSSSWGPLDNGATLEGPGPLAQQALENGAKYGRGGKGAIFVWASGNGGKFVDSCGCDGYAGSIYTITVGSISQNGKLPWYGEMCTAILTVTYSSGGNREQMVVTFLIMLKSANLL
jgi:proprotein convertase subtilisin/kexin type 1